ncbi:MAG: 7-carboxy-7-deazaguanine synthase QueE, partial [Planctomycetota bacterium]
MTTESRSCGRHTTTTGGMKPGTSLTDALRLFHQDPRMHEAGLSTFDEPPVLNPVFVEMLMGFPDGWTAFESLGTPASRYRSELRSWIYLTDYVRRLRQKPRKTVPEKKQKSVTWEQETKKAPLAKPKKGLVWVNEIFLSVQGEGCWQGKLAAFLRLSRCNLQCQGCDTSFNQYQEMEIGEVVEQIEALGSRFVILTGGEPSVHPGLVPLLQGLKEAQLRVHMESNGFKALDEEAFELVDWLTVSPKTRNFRQRKGSELKVVVTPRADDEWIDVCLDIAREGFGKKAWLQPLWNQDDEVDPNSLSRCLEIIRRSR